MVGTSNTVHFHQDVQQAVIQRIIELKEAGMGYRNISKQLKKEGLANMSKSTVGNLYRQQALPLMKKTEKELADDREYQALSAKESIIREDVNRFRMLEEKRKRIKGFYLEKAKTVDGVKDIFSSPKKMLDFTKNTCEYECLGLGNAEILKNFTSYCKTHGLPLSKTLFEAVGSLKEYRTNAAGDGIHGRLDNYISLFLEFFLDDRKEEEKQAMLQRRFEKTLVEAECIDCGSSLGQPFRVSDGSCEYTFMLIDGSMQCYHCDASYDPKCPSCGESLTYQGNLGFQCASCNLTLQLDLQSRRNGIKVEMAYPYV